MGAIVDILLLSQEDISLLKKRYPNCLLTNIDNNKNLTKHYRFILQGEDLDGDSYYNFLLDNLIATASANFRSRLESDPKFTERMRARVAANLSKFQVDTKRE
jgi:hypothetical protein